MSRKTVGMEKRLVDCTPGHATTMWSERQKWLRRYEDKHMVTGKPGEEVLQGKHQKLLGDKK